MEVKISPPFRKRRAPETNKHSANGSTNGRSGPKRNGTLSPLALRQDIRHPEDFDLTRKALAGDEDARREFVRRLKCVPPILRSMQRGASFSAEDVEDVTQRAMFAIWSKLETFDGRSKLETWAYGFCGYELLKWRERKGRSGNVMGDEVLSETASPVREERQSEDLSHVRAAVDSLGPPTSTIIHSKHFEGLTFQEIGERMDLSPNSAKTYYYRGLKKLRMKLQRSWDQEQP